MFLPVTGNLLNSETRTITVRIIEFETRTITVRIIEFETRTITVRIIEFETRTITVVMIWDYYKCAAHVTTSARYLPTERELDVLFRLLGFITASMSRPGETDTFNRWLNFPTMFPLPLKC